MNEEEIIARCSELKDEIHNVCDPLERFYMSGDSLTANSALGCLVWSRIEKIGRKINELDDETLEPDGSSNDHVKSLADSYSYLLSAAFFAYIRNGYAFYPEPTLRSLTK